MNNKNSTCITGEEFTKKLDSIISPSAVHSLDEWQKAVDDTYKLLSDLKLYAGDWSFPNPDLIPQYHEPDKYRTRFTRIGHCAQSVFNYLFQILNSDQSSHKIPELLRSAWYELISFFDYSPNLNINNDDVLIFVNTLCAFQKTLSLLKSNT